MTYNQTCADCGFPLPQPGKGRPQLVCGECRRGRRRVKERVDGACVDCGTTFRPPSHTGRIALRCDDCQVLHARAQNTAKMMRWRKAHPEQAKANGRAASARRLADPFQRQLKRETMVRRTYGLEPHDIERMLTEQDHLCAICRNGHVGHGSRLHVDHDHATGKVRSLLCSKCNTMLGLAGDSADRLELAAEYLRRHSLS